MTATLGWLPLSPLRLWAVAGRGGVMSFSRCRALSGAVSQPPLEVVGVGRARRATVRRVRLQRRRPGARQRAGVGLLLLQQAAGMIVGLGLGVVRTGCLDAPDDLRVGRHGTSPIIPGSLAGGSRLSEPHVRR